ncbi:MAG: cytochrome c oxidase subunit 3 [Xanthomonadaceae bacterium]|nr:cytochrome c oxidase subunit 3 [Xanthomonadaceae bacterium]MDE1885458.1 cytochrome c oxidase subunit 3 [Xanthomonadaceae bacterium]MDE1960623.1 cytochrome c oxidase subunit 3 [Xanthomonadaceae bacterium]MDE2085298.1 cytochrome c oxidase subunit 3 [Xanthomonadaceae bacterium]MDE2257206.1 cytochrome c oxidase subunit 3 [Xanthomonadaceae bacterium]
MSSQAQGAYYVPHGTRWPILGSFGLFFTVGGAALWMNEFEPGKYVMALGIACILSMLFGWFRTVIGESLAGTYSKQVDTSFRMGMMWFIFSEVMFFGAFFGALFYVRNLSIPWLGGIGDGSLTNYFLWKDFAPAWPTNGPEQVGGIFQTMPAWGVPLLNTLILLSSGVTITVAHHALRAGNRRQLLIWLGATIVLGALFLNFQAHEYIEAYTKLNLTLDTGIYGSTFFMLTGFHGMHVTLGAIMLTVIWFRCLRGHFTRDHHFAFEAVAWYWHFVDVVWLGLFIFVYVL